MNFIPVMLNVSDRKVVVIGGGEAAFKKVRNLAAHCSSITVIASDFHEDISSFNVEKVKMQIGDASQIESYLGRDTIVIIATDNPDLNSSLSSMCSKLGIMYNRIDDNKSPFIFPASFESEGIIVSISTLGKSPSFARYLREQLKIHIDTYAKALPILQRLRENMRIEDFHQRSEYFWNLLHNDEFWKRVSDGRFEDAYDLGLKVSEELDS